MKATHVMVEFEKMVSDGNYGRERAVVQFAADLEDDEDPQRAVMLLLSQARNRLVEQLRQSESRTVRRAINPPANLCSDCQKVLSDDEDYRCATCDAVLKERYRQQEEERQARYAAQRREQLVPVGVDDEGPDEDEPL